MMDAHAINIVAHQLCGLACVTHIDDGDVLLFHVILLHLEVGYLLVLVPGHAILLIFRLPQLMFSLI